MQGLAVEIRRARQDRDAERRDDLARENRRFVQVYPKGWSRLQRLIRRTRARPGFMPCLPSISTPTGALSSLRRRSWRRCSSHRPHHQDADQDPRRTGRDRSDTGRGGTYAYALDPDEVWKAWDVQKDHAVFRTKTLVSKRGENAVVKRRLQVMIAGDERRAGVALGR